MAERQSVGYRISQAWKALLGSVPPAELKSDLAFADPYSYIGTQLRYNPSVLVSRKGLDIFKDMMRDDQVKAALTFKKRAALASGWHICSPEGLPEDDERKALLEECFDAIDGTFDKALYEMLSCLDFGFSITEKIFAENEQGRLVLSALKTRDPRPWVFEQDEYGNVTGLRQLPNNKADLPQGKFVHYVYNRQFSNPYGQSDLEAAYRPWAQKENAYRYLGMMLERYGIPPLFLLYNPKAYSAELIAKIETIAKRLQAATSAVIPRPTKDDSEFYTPEVAGQVSNVFIPAFQMFNQDIARALLMPGLLGLTADAQEGSFARAQVHFDAFMLVIEDVRKELENIVNEQIVDQIMLLNYPDRPEGNPYFEFLPLTDDVKVELLNTYRDLVSAGALTKQPDDEDHIREMMKFPALAEQPQPEQNSPPAPGTSPQQTPGNGIPVADEQAPTEPEPAAGGEADQKPPADEVAAQRLWRKSRMVRIPGRKHYRIYQELMTRPMTTAEKRVDFAQVSKQLDTLEQAAITAMRQVLGRMQMAFQQVVVDDLEDGQLDTVTAMTQVPMAGELARALEDAMIEALGDGRAQVIAELSMARRFADYTPRDALAYLRTKAVEMAGVVESRILGQVKASLLTALKSGEPLSDTTARLAQIFEPYIASGVVDPSITSPFRLEVIARTNLTDALNQGRLAQARTADTGFITGYLYSAIIDSRTTEVCRLLDGKFFNASDPDVDRLTPPRHYNCRSVLVPLTLDTGLAGATPISASEKTQALALSQDGF